MHGHVYMRTVAKPSFETVRLSSGVVYRSAYTDMCIDMHADKCIDICADRCIGVHGDARTCMCAEMCTDVWIDMCGRLKNVLTSRSRPLAV